MIVRNKILQLVIGGLALVLAVCGCLMLGGVIDHSIKEWVWAILILCLGINIIEMFVYFFFSKTPTIKIICRWMNIFTACVMLVVVTAGLIQAISAGLFTAFDRMSGWFNLLYIIANYALIAIIIVYIVCAKKEDKLEEEMQKYLNK